MQQMQQLEEYKNEVEEIIDMKNIIIDQYVEKVNEMECIVMDLQADRELIHETYSQRGVREIEEQGFVFTAYTDLKIRKFVLFDITNMEQADVLFCHQSSEILSKEKALNIVQNSIKTQNSQPLSQQVIQNLISLEKSVQHFKQQIVSLTKQRDKLFYLLREEQVKNQQNYENKQDIEEKKYHSHFINKSSSIDAELNEVNDFTPNDKYNNIFPDSIQFGQNHKLEKPLNKNQKKANFTHLFPSYQENKNKINESKGENKLILKEIEPIKESKQQNQQKQIIKEQNQSEFDNCSLKNSDQSEKVEQNIETNEEKDSEKKNVRKNLKLNIKQKNNTRNNETSIQKLSPLIRKKNPNSKIMYIRK